MMRRTLQSRLGKAWLGPEDMTVELIAGDHEAPLSLPPFGLAPVCSLASCATRPVVVDRTRQSRPVFAPMTGANEPGGGHRPLFRREAPSPRNHRTGCFHCMIF